MGPDHTGLANGITVHMTLQSYFRLTLLLPVLVIGALELASPGNRAALDETLPAFLSELWFHSEVAIQMGWLQYLGLALYLAWGFSRWSLQRSLVNATLGPLYYALISLVTLFVYANLWGDPIAEDAGIFIAVLSLTYGYLYVGLVLAGYYVLKRFGALTS